MNQTTLPPEQSQTHQDIDFNFDALSQKFDYFDNCDQRALPAKIARGMMLFHYYRGIYPNVAWVNMRNLEGCTEEAIGGCKIFITNGVLPNHFQFYVNEFEPMNPGPDEAVQP